MRKKPYTIIAGQVNHNWLEGPELNEKQQNIFENFLGYND